MWRFCQNLFFVVHHVVLEVDSIGQRYSARPLLYDGHNIFGYFKALLAR
jgi:hypothetical protein